MPPRNLSLLSATEPLTLDLPDAELRLWPRAFAAEEADRLYAALRTGIDWQQEDILIFGERRQVPRLVAWHGDPDATYTYSGTVHMPRPWTDDLLLVRERLQSLTGHRYNSVLLNLYRDGRDGMGWHADDEPELGERPAIASLSLGAVRRFRLRHRHRADARLALDLGHGDLLLMAGGTQNACQHALAKTVRQVGERINLTYRRVWPRRPAAARRLDQVLRGLGEGD
jgi:alkylated DNA repair dioxygenase AlkB